MNRQINKKNILKWQGKTALITGASGGIGAEIAKKLATEGLHVILVARREELLIDLAREITSRGGNATVLPADLSDEKERRRVFNRVMDQFGHLDVLVNNAGFGWYGYTQE
ncbi:MAG: SDR family NAD(P)-dependent oxidoreductase, partial [Anaerolineaceae bacterium]